MKDGHDCRTLVGFLQKSSTLSKAAIEIISTSWRQGTEKRYYGHIKRFVDFCHKRQADPLCAITKTGIEFLNEYFNTGVGYSAVNSARSALSFLIKALHGIPFGEDPLVSRFLRGVLNIRPALPQYVTTWNVSKGFQYLGKQQALVNCELKAVLHRLPILLCLTTGQRDQTIKFLNLECLKVFDDRAILFIPDKLKTTRPRHHLPPLEIKTYKDVELCVVSHLRQYIKLTENLRKGDDKQLLLSYVKPYKPISTTTLSRWCVSIMKESGINVDIFGSHSTRAASTSRCKAEGPSFKEISESAGWSIERPFALYCDKSIEDNFSEIFL